MILISENMFYIYLKILNFKKLIKLRLVINVTIHIRQ